MRVLLVNVPHPAIGSRIPDDHLPPLGLLAVGGPLLDDGHAVRLIDGEFGPMPLPDLIRAAVAWAPDAVLFGHSGSTSGHPVIAAVARAVAARLPAAAIVYGGVYPTYHWREILAEEPHLTAIVRGEGEEQAAVVVAEVLPELPGPLRDAPWIVFIDIRKHRRIAQCIEPGLVTPKDGELRNQLAHLFGRRLAVRARGGRH